jgi:uncharacterized membrane protein
MARLEKSIVINAPVEKVFAFVDEPTNLPSIWPALEAISDVERLPSGGSNSRYVYKMGGLRFEGHSVTTEYVPNQRLVTRSKGGIESTIRWVFQPEGGGTRVTFEADYTVPIPLLGKIAEAILVRQNEQEAETILANLKARMEA